MGQATPTEKQQERSIRHHCKVCRTAKYPKQNAAKGDTKEVEIQAQQQRLEEKVQQMQEELVTMHKKVDELNKVIICTQQQHSPKEEKARTPSSSQKMEDTEQEALTENEETQNNKPSNPAIAQDHELTTKRPSVENHLEQATQNETIIKRNKRSKKKYTKEYQAQRLQRK